MKTETRKRYVVPGTAPEPQFKAWAGHYKTGGTIPDNGISQAEKDTLKLSIESFSHYIPRGLTVNAEQFSEIIERNNTSPQAAEIIRVLRSI